MFGSALCRTGVALNFVFLLVPTLAPSADRNTDSMIRIAAGDFFMGSDNWPEDERPRSAAQSRGHVVDEPLAQFLATYSVQYVALLRAVEPPAAAARR